MIGSSYTSDDEGRDGGTPDSDCEDSNDNCAYWASVGECKANPNYMLENCKKSCNNCGSDKEKEDPNCVDENASCEAWATRGECEANPNYMLVNCRKSCKQC